MSSNDLEYRIAKPDASLSDFVESFWMLINHSSSDKDIAILPDGRIDLFFSYADSEPFNAIILGLETEPSQTTFAAKTIIFAVSFKLLATEYLLNFSVSDLLDEVRVLPEGFFDITKNDLSDFDQFCKKVSGKLKNSIREKVDPRKQKLFENIYASHGTMSVSELADKCAWSSRQINRYFNQQFGLSLKSYCNILRFRSSFEQIKEGKLFPDHDFTDQAHFIKEVKKFSGVVPKELARNKNDRFIQFSTLKKK